MSSPVIVPIISALLACALIYVIALRRHGLPQKEEERAQISVLMERLAGRERQLDERDEAIRILRGTELGLTEELRRAERENSTLKERLNHQLDALEHAKTEMRAEFEKTAKEVLRGSGETFLNLAEAKLRGQQESATGELNTKKAEIEGLINPMATALNTLDEKVRNLKQSEEGLLHETQQLSRALRESKYRGNWGELQLKRIAELAGMLERCDFYLQEKVVTDENRRLYPDMTARLPNDRVIVVDSKVSLDAYKEAVNAIDPEVYKQKLLDHAKGIRKRVADLSGKEYRSHVDASADFVVYFIPGESFFSAALAADPELLEYAAERNVILASPTTLLTLLRAVALGWQQLSIAKNADAIKETSLVIYGKLAGLYEDLIDLGNRLKAAGECYDDIVTKVEGRGGVFSSARKLRDLGIGEKYLEDGKKGEIRSVGLTLRPLEADDWQPLLALAAEAENAPQ
jgi:DNA recombination protein RmuC